MYKNDYFNNIYQKCQSDYEKVIELLKARGFLIDIIQEDVYMSDNSHKDDIYYLKSILEKNDMGTVNNKKIFIKNPYKYFFIENEFQFDEQMNYEICQSSYGWDYFRYRVHGHKVAVQDLEPFIARYVKALSSVGVVMAGSCDGNKVGEKYALVQYEDCCSSFWHILICEKLKEYNIDLKWTKGGRLYFDANSKEKIYNNLNVAADIIYRNRVELRNIKQKVLAEYSNSFLKRNYDQMIIVFSNKVREEFKKISFY